MTFIPPGGIIETDTAARPAKEGRRTMTQSRISTPERVDSYSHDKERILTRLRRMEGQVRGVHRMVEEDKYCVDILTQLSSIIAAARGIGLLLLEDHIRGCVLNAEDKEAKIQELT